MSSRISGLILALIGAAFCLDGLRVMRQLRATSVFDSLGPDGYMILTGGVLVFVALLTMFERPVKAPSRDEDGTTLPIVLAVVVGGYAILIPLLGYAGATFLFFIAAYYIAGQRNIGKALILSTISALMFYVIFPKLADMPLPSGLLGY